MPQSGSEQHRLLRHFNRLAHPHDIAGHDGVVVRRAVGGGVVLVGSGGAAHRGVGSAGGVHWGGGGAE